MVEKIEGGMNLVSYVAKYKHLSTKTRRKPKSHEENSQTGSRGARTAVRPRQHDRATLTTAHGGGCPGCFSRFPNAAFCTCSCPRALPMFGHFGPLLLSSLIF